MRDNSKNRLESALQKIRPLKIQNRLETAHRKPCAHAALPPNQPRACTRMPREQKMSNKKTGLDPLSKKKCDIGKTKISLESLTGNLFASDPCPSEAVQAPLRLQILVFATPANTRQKNIGAAAVFAIFCQICQKKTSSREPREHG